MKHSGASMVKLNIKNGKHIEIKVTDNGSGFNYQEQEKSTSGSGLRSVKNRISLYNGELTVNSVPGNGTTVNIRLNYKPIV